MYRRTKIKAAPVPAALLIIILSLSGLPACHGGGAGAGVPLLAVGAPVRDIVELLGFNQYAVPVIPGALYKVSITELSDDVDLFVFGTDGTFTTLAQCSFDNTGIIGPVSEDCVIPAAGDFLYLAVDGTFLAATSGLYTIAVERLFPTDLNPSVPLADAVERTGAALYAVPVISGTAYTVSITGMTDDAELAVFGSDGSFSVQALCEFENRLFPGTVPEDCTLAPAGATLFFLVDGIFSSASAVSYTALVTPAPFVAAPANEGSPAAPVSVLSHAPRTGQVAVLGTSFYMAAGLTAPRYTVSITGLTSNANLAVFGADFTFTNLAACLIGNTFLPGPVPEACTLTAEGGTLFFAVSAGPEGSVYTVLVEPGP